MNQYHSNSPYPAQPLPGAALAAHGFLPEVIERWAETGVQTLLPLQANAVMSTGLLRGDNVLLLAPTSAGKTFVAELAAVRHWQSGLKAVFLCPTRALAAEQYRHLSHRYAPLGIRVCLATADHTRHDGRIRAGEFDFAVMVYEKLRAFLVTGPDLLYHLGVVIADELQILGDPDRGEVADLLLTRLTRAEPAVQVIGLSAVVDSARELSGWLGAQTLMETKRPVELREGIYCTEHCAFHYQSTAGGPWQDEALTAVAESSAEYHPSVTFETPLVKLCADLARAGESCLVFVPTRPMSRQLCMAIAAELGISPEKAAGAYDWEELRMAEDCLARRQLMESAPAGVAFHNSDLSAELRAVIEQAFDAGDIKVVVATPTLAQGVNLRARNVIQVPTMLRGDGKTAGVRAAQVPLSVERYRNQAGRAGRVGSGAAYGRSIVVAGGHMEAQRLARAYVQCQPGPLQPHFSNHSMDQFVLECVHAGTGDTYTGIHHALAETFAWHSGAVTAGNALEDQLGESIRGLLDFQLLEESAGHRLRLTGLGQAMAAGGFKASTVKELVTACHDWNADAPGDFALLCACAFTADGEQFALSATPGEIQNNTWLRAARDLLKDEGASVNEIGRLLLPTGGLSHAGHSSLKKAVVAHGWISETSTSDLEEQQHVVAGTTAAVAAHLAWIAGGLATCAAVVQCPDDVIAAIKRVAARLPQGLSARAVKLAALQIPGLSRNYLNRLAAEGYDSMETLQQATSEDLQSILPPLLSERICEALRTGVNLVSHTEPCVSTSTGIPKGVDQADRECPAPVFSVPVLEVPDPVASHDLILDRTNPGAVIFYGKDLRLPPKPYALLMLLAQRCGTTVAYTTIDEVVWPDEKVEPQQISAHKSTLIRELARVTAREQAEEAIVTDPRYGLRLNLRPERVQVRVESQRNMTPARPAKFAGCAPLGAYQAPCTRMSSTEGPG